MHSEANESCQEYGMSSGFVIAATSSGCGKTTVTLGLLRAMRRRGLNVAPFKCGPDYIDTQWHGIAAKRDSINLDTFMSSENGVRRLFCRYGSAADVCVVEGVMGMFDGYDRMKGSSAHVAAMLGLPVVLIVNAASTAYSVAAVIFGFKNFCADIKIAGVIFNNVASDRHYSFLLSACEDAGVPCLGYLKRMPGLELPSRHLGLTLESEAFMENHVNVVADAIETGVDIDALLAATRHDDIAYEPVQQPGVRPKLRLGVAKDEAFNFIYRANIDAFVAHPRYDVELKYFSPIHDKKLPDVDMLYFPGGYPELYADELSANQPMRDAVKQFAEAGGRILAECGGFIYMCNDIDSSPMCGVLPLAVTMEGAKLTLGYRTVEFGEWSIRGHEFHYSRVVNGDGLKSIARQYNASGKDVSTPVYRYKNVVAGYTHFYWGETDILKLWE